MTMLSKYYVPGLAIEDHSIDVPLDWTGHEPGRAFDGEPSNCSIAWSPRPNMCMTTCRC